MYQAIDLDVCDNMPRHGRRHFIYALIDPRTNLVRYIGASVNVAERLACHLTAPANPELGGWIAELKSIGLLPTVRTLTDVYGYHSARFVEATYIDEYERFQGGLLNREFVSASQRKFRYDEEARLKLVAIKKQARKETNFYSRVAGNRAPRGSRSRPSNYV